MLTPPYQDLGPADARQAGRDRLPPHGPRRHRPSRGADQASARNDAIAETIKIVSTSLLGLTVGCAQCHDHRYDPIPQEDYYRFRALFEPAYDVARLAIARPRAWSRSGPRTTAAAAESVDAEVKAIERERAKADRGPGRRRSSSRSWPRPPRSSARKLREARDTPAGEADRRAEAAGSRPTQRLNVMPGNVTLYDAKAFAAITKDFASESRRRASSGPPRTSSTP